MKCDFCDATKVKLISITYKGKPSTVCLSCQEFDGIRDDGAKS